MKFLLVCLIALIGGYMIGEIAPGIIGLLSTLPSAVFGAVFALLLFKLELSIMALIGLFLLIGIAVSMIGMRL